MPAGFALGYYRVMHVWVHKDPLIACMATGGETIETTPEHPFYTADGEWVAAGDLHVGDTVLKADGEYGIVEAIEFVHQPQPMYDLTVITAHTYFAGDGQWLVHNACDVSAVAEDWAKKGAHVKVDGIELTIRPNETGDGVVIIKTFGKKYDAATRAAIEKVRRALETDQQFRKKLYEHVSKAVEYVLQFPESGGTGRSAELNFLKVALERMGMGP